jgi:hypothetical protein
LDTFFRQTFCFLAHKILFIRLEFLLFYLFPDLAVVHTAIKFEAILLHFNNLKVIFETFCFPFIQSHKILVLNATCALVIFVKLNSN